MRQRKAAETTYLQKNREARLQALCNLLWQRPCTRHQKSESWESRKVLGKVQAYKRPVMNQAVRVLRLSALCEKCTKEFITWMARTSRSPSGLARTESMSPLCKTRRPMPLFNRR